MTAKGKLLIPILNRIIQDQLAPKYSDGEIGKILTSTKIEYRAIVDRMPNMGSIENAHVKVLYAGAYIIALYQQLQDQIPLELFQSMIQSGLGKSTLLRRQISKQDLFSKRSMDKLEKAALWAKTNKDQYIWTWQINIPKNTKSEGVYFEFTRCGLCHLCKAEGVPEIMPLMCSLDYAALSYGNARVIRSKTLAAGDDCCDFLLLPSKK